MNTERPSGISTDYDVQFRMYWYSIRRHTRLIVFCILFSTTLMGIRLHTKQNLYQASTEILIENQGQFVGDYSNYYQVPKPINLNILKHRITSTPVINKIREMLGSGVQVNRGNFRVIFPSSRESSRLSNQTIATIITTSFNAEHSYRMVQSIVKAFRSQLMDNKLQQSRESLSWMAERLSDQKKKVEEAERRFQEYKQQIKVLSFEDQQTEESRRILNASVELSHLENDRMQMEVKYNKLRNSQNKELQYSDLVFQSQNIEAVKDLLVQTKNKQSELDTKLKVFKSKHPQVIELNKQINSLRSRIESEKSNVISTLNIQIKTLKDRESVLGNSIINYKQSASDIGQKELQYRILQREVQTNSELYNTLMTELERTDLRGKIESTLVTVIEPPYKPLMPISKRIPRKMILAFLLGLVLGCGIAILIDYFEPTFRTPEDVERIIGIPVVGVIPEKE